MILSFFCFSFLFAQNIPEMVVVGNGKLLEEFISHQMRDSEDNVCAGLKIISDLDNLTFEGNKRIVDIDFKPGSFLLYLSPDTKMIIVHKAGYKSLQILLEEYGISLKSTQVWQLAITSEAKSNEIPILINSEPSGATIFLDGENRGTNNNQKTLPGSHTVRLEKKGYKTTSKNIQVDESNIDFTIEMEEMPLQRVSIDSEPNGADIFINNAKLFDYKTEAYVNLFPGEYEISLRKEGYYINDKIEVIENGKNNFYFELKKQKTSTTDFNDYGELIIETVTPKVKIRINKKFVKDKTLKLPTGIYKINIDKQGYFSQVEIIEIFSGKTVKKKYTLKPVEKKGRLLFNISPEKANVNIEGKNYNLSWKGYKYYDDTPPGEYKLQCKLIDYLPVIKDIIIEENKLTEIDIQLRKRPFSDFELNIEPEKTKITLKNEDYNFKWKGSVQKKIPIGEYKIKFNLSGYNTVRKNIQIQENELTKENIKMEYSFTPILDGKIEVTGLDTLYSGEKYKDYDNSLIDVLKKESFYQALTRAGFGYLIDYFSVNKSFHGYGHGLTVKIVYGDADGADLIYFDKSFGGKVNGFVFDVYDRAPELQKLINIKNIILPFGFRTNFGWIKLYKNGKSKERFFFNLGFGAYLTIITTKDFLIKYRINGMLKHEKPFLYEIRNEFNTLISKYFSINFGYNYNLIIEEFTISFDVAWLYDRIE